MSCRAQSSPLRPLGRHWRHRRGQCAEQAADPFLGPQMRPLPAQRGPTKPGSSGPTIGPFGFCFSACQAGQKFVSCAKLIATKSCGQLEWAQHGRAERAQIELNAHKIKINSHVVRVMPLEMGREHPERRPNNRPPPSPGWRPFSSRADPSPCLAGYLCPREQGGSIVVVVVAVVLVIDGGGVMIDPAAR